MNALQYTVLLLLLISSVGSLAAQQERPTPVSLSRAHRQISLDGLSRTWRRYWDKNYLVTYGTEDSIHASPDKPGVALYDQRGEIAREAIVWFKDAYDITLTDAAVNSKGDLIVAGGTENEAGVVANFVALIGSDNHIARLIRTTPFVPRHVCLEEDGTVWGYGTDRDADGRRIESSLMLRHYSFDKGQIDAMLDKSTLDSAGWNLLDGRYPGEVNLRCTSKQVGLFNAASSEWIQVDLATNTLKISKFATLPSPKEVRVTGFAFTESGDGFVSLHDRHTLPAHSGIFKLTFDSTGVGSWSAVGNTIGLYQRGGPVERLLGTDGTELIYTKDLSGVAHWSKVTTP